MVRVREIAFVSFSALLLIFNSGCASLGKNQLNYSDAPASEIFLAVPPDFQSEVSLLKWSGKVSENEKISYLLDRIAASNYRFIRNGETYDGKITRRWLLYKMHQWVSDVDTAEKFVARVADGSQKTGQPYLVELSPGKFYSLKSVLRNELSLLEKLMTHPEPIAPERGKTILSATTIATAAVATSGIAPSNS